MTSSATHNQANSAPHATIVIPAHNEAAKITRTVEAVQAAQIHALAQGIYTELVIVCNACTDTTFQMCVQMGLEPIDENKKGIAHARQAGHNASQAEIVLCTDADSQVPHSWITSHIEHYQDPQVVGVGGHVEFDYVHPMYTHIKQVWQRLREMRVRAKRSLGATPVYSKYFLGANMSYRRSAVDRVGGFDPKYHHGEDRLLAEKLRTVGHIVEDPRPECRVVTSGRRFNTPGKVARFVYERAWGVFKAEALAKPAVSEDHTDIR
jgi:cellulose synthase/poly-beta-1,6-N-acetylglucosamine synthase-like glycosyltransferase